MCSHVKYLLKRVKFTCIKHKSRFPSIHCRQRGGYSSRRFGSSHKPLTLLLLADSSYRRAPYWFTTLSPTVSSFFPQGMLYGADHNKTVDIFVAGIIWELMHHCRSV